MERRARGRSPGRALGGGFRGGGHLGALARDGGRRRDGGDERLGRGEAGRGVLRALDGARGGARDRVGEGGARRRGRGRRVEARDGDEDVGGGVEVARVGGGGGVAREPVGGVARGAEGGGPRARRGEHRAARLGGDGDGVLVALGDGLAREPNERRHLVAAFGEVGVGGGVRRVVRI